jgi:hypothetical protein
MRTIFHQLGRVLGSHHRQPRSVKQSTIRKLACEPLTSRIVLTASPLMALAMPEDPSSAAVCVPLNAADVSWGESESAEVEQDEAFSLSDPMAAMDSQVESPASTSAAVDAAMAAFSESATTPTEGETTPSHEESPDDFGWLSLEMLDSIDEQESWLEGGLPEEGTLADPAVGGATTESMPPTTFVNTWDSLLPEGEGDDLFGFPPMDPTLPEPGGDDLMDPDDDFEDPWGDDPYDPMGDFTMVTFTAKWSVGGYVLEGSIDYPYGSPQGLTINFGGLAIGHSTSVYHDGSFYYHLMMSDSYTGTISAQAVDSNGLTSQTLYAFVWA